jgi:protein SCO1/2
MFAPAAMILALFSGHPLVVTFVSAHCTSICPLVDAEIARAAARERASHGDLRFLTVTLDPERDTDADLSRIARTFGADPQYWRIIGGAPQTIHALMRQFGVIVTRGPDGYADAHTTPVVVLDSHRKVVTQMLPSLHLAEQLARVDVR